MVRQIISIAAGFGLWSALWLGGNALMRSVAPAGTYNDDGSTNSVGMLIILLLFSFIVSAAAGYVMMMVAPAETLRNAIILGVILLVVGIGVQSAYWNVMPLWYHLLFLGGLLPLTVLGASLRLS